MKYRINYFIEAVVPYLRLTRKRRMLVSLGKLQPQQNYDKLKKTCSYNLHLLDRYTRKHLKSTENDGGRLSKKQKLKQDFSAPKIAKYREEKK